MSTVPTISTKLRQQAIEHICYEIERLAHAFRRLVALPVSRPSIESNDLIEIVLLHSRALIVFFEQTRAKRKPGSKEWDDMLAEDFDFPPRSLTIAPETTQRMNKEIAHLTYFRCGLTEDQKRWPWRDFVPPICRRSDEFLVHLLTTQSTIMTTTDRLDIEQTLQSLRGRVTKE